MEMLLPFIMAKIIDDGIEKGNMTNVYIFGGVMIVAASGQPAFGLSCRKICGFCFIRLCLQSS